MNHLLVNRLFFLIGCVEKCREGEASITEVNLPATSEVKCCTVPLNAWLDEMHITFLDRDFKPGLPLTAAWPLLTLKTFAEILPRFISKHASHEANNRIFLTATLVFIGLFRRMKLVQARPWDS